MSHVDWEMQGLEITTCNCDYGCPCQFNALPTRGNCRATVAMRVDRGHFGDVKLDGTLWAGLFAWPKAIHEGNGEAAVIIDERATEAQRGALLTILSGGETEPGATIFNVFAGTFTKMHPPLFRRIEFDGDLATAKARLTVPGIVEMTTSPITNPVTGAEHRATVNLPHGFEYTSAEYCSGQTKTASEAPIAHDWDGRHAHLARLHLTPRGPVR